MLACCELRREAREDGLKGVVGRDGIRVREVDLCRVGRWLSFGVVDILNSRLNFSFEL